MPFSNYGELKDELSKALFHQRFVERYDSFTAMFEADANSRLRVWPQEASTNLTTTNGQTYLPEDYLLWRTVKDTTRPTYPELDYVHPAYLPPSTSHGVPAVFTIEGNQFITRPINDAAGVWEFHYYRKLPSLLTGGDTATSWLLTSYPNVYLFGLMTEAAAFGRNQEMAQLYKARRDEVFAEIIQRYALTTGATSPSVRTAEYF
jgi:hypothetical protein